jgi:hypothetical protein
MYRTFLKSLAIALSLNATSLGQSAPALGDVARANREKLAAQEAAGTMPRVITNKDLPAAPPQVQEASASQPMTMVSGVKRPFERPSSDQRFAEQSLADQPAGEPWRGRIQAQESRIADRQARLDQMNASMHPAGGSAQYEGPYNRYQAREMQRVAQMQEKLDQQRRRLYMMQEAARRAGMHTSVYDP